ncbi:Rab-GAP TBC domain-containing protein [Mucor velutinosus]|uniref:Rab-GAP TBC domain-containing protein n=1 Tax=Mucor velutinosus TaxID=708070 RepID=A0AAN7D657_9FUNG|nr:Rab-GAP TBC domain-containing protein [Mucor velutinosus]
MFNRLRNAKKISVAKYIKSFIDDLKKELAKAQTAAPKVGGSNAGKSKRVNQALVELRLALLKPLDQKQMSFKLVMLELMRQLAERWFIKPESFKVYPVL